MNALNFDLVCELEEEILKLENSDGIRVVILSGQGEKAFCAGADLKERSAFDEEKTQIFLDKLNNVCNSIEDSKHIYIASINGFAFGGGFELALSCDFRFATANSMLGLPEVCIGVMPGAGGVSRAVKVCGISNAQMIAITGKKFEATEAKELQMIHEVFEAKAELEEYICKFAKELLANAPIAISNVKKAINYPFAQTRKQALNFERQLYSKLLTTKDKQEGLDAFLQKRHPKFLGL
jgi:enoyl-CoA hydratase/carnithine racemase